MDDLTHATPEELARLLLEREKANIRRHRQAQREVDAEERPVIPLRIYDDAAFDALPPANWLVHGVLLQSGLGLMVGEPGSYKTFTMLDLALSIASHQPTWLGNTLNRHGAVVYVAAEGQGRFKYRKNVWKQEHQIAQPLPFYTLPQAVDLRNPQLMSAFLTQITPWHPVLIVFDTLSRCIPGAEENSAKELGEAIAACDIIKNATGANVQLVHHPRKDGMSSRGSSAGLGAVDSELWMNRTSDKNLFTLSVGKQKEGDDELTINLKRRIVELAGEREPDSGEPVTSCVIELADAADLRKAATSLERRILEFVAAHPNIKKGAVSVQMQLKKKSVDAAIDMLLLDGRLSQSKGGRGGKAKLLTFVSFTNTNPFAGP